MMGSMGGMSPTITWVKPEGEKPDWLTRGEKSLRAREEMRRRLDKGDGSIKRENSNSTNQPLSSVVTFIYAWDDQGGDASCHLIGSVLLVEASEGMHEEIERFLSLLNEKRPKDNKADSRDPFGE